VAGARVSVVDITRMVRLRRRCVFGALVGYIAAGFLVLFVFAHPAFLVAAIVLTFSSWYAEHGNRPAAIVHVTLTSISIAFIVWAWFDFHAGLERLAEHSSFRHIRPDAHASLTLLVGLGAVGIGVTTWSFVSLLQYNRELAARGMRQPRVAFLLRWTRMTAFVESPHFLRMTAYFVLSVASIAIPAAAYFGWMRKMWASPDAPSFGWLLPAIVGFLVCLATSRWAFARATRSAALGVAEARERDRRPPVLLLRSFGDDLVSVAPMFRARTFRAGPAAVRQRTLEECLEQALWRYGPVIAVGLPGETLPPAGAAREYLPNEQWRTAVRERIAEAHLVVVILGRTVGLRDEYRMLAECGALEKVAAVFPPVESTERSARWATFAEEAPRAPQLTPGAVSRGLLVRPAPDGSSSLITCQWDDEECYLLGLRCIMGVHTQRPCPV
jgi:hypothetical protein